MPRYKSDPPSDGATPSQKINTAPPSSGNAAVVVCACPILRLPTLYPARSACSLCMVLPNRSPRKTVPDFTIQLLHTLLTRSASTERSGGTTSIQELYFVRLVAAEPPLGGKWGYSGRLCLLESLQGSAKVGSARGVAPSNPNFLAVVARQSRVTTARKRHFRGGRVPCGCLTEPHQSNFDVA